MKLRKISITKLIFNFPNFLLLILITLLPFIIGITFYNFFNPFLKNTQIINNIIFSFEWNPIENKYGILNFLIISVKIICLSFLLSSIFSISTSIYLNQFLPNKFFSTILSIFEFMNYIPSVIYGYFGIFFLLPLINIFFDSFNIQIKSYPIISASILLAFMTLPFTVTFITKIFRKNYDIYFMTFSDSSITKFELFKFLIKKIYKSILYIFLITLTRIAGETILLWMIFTYFLTSEINTLFNIQTIGYPINVLIIDNYSKLFTSTNLKYILVLLSFFVFITNYFLNFIINIFFRKLVNYENK